MGSTCCAKDFRFPNPSHSPPHRHHHHPQPCSRPTVEVETKAGARDGHACTQHPPARLLDPSASDAAPRVGPAVGGGGGWRKVLANAAPGEKKKGGKKKKREEEKKSSATTAKMLTLNAPPSSCFLASFLFPSSRSVTIFGCSQMHGRLEGSRVGHTFPSWPGEHVG